MADRTVLDEIAAERPIHLIVSSHPNNPNYLQGCACGFWGSLEDVRRHAAAANRAAQEATDGP